MKTCYVNSSIANEKIGSLYKVYFVFYVLNVYCSSSFQATTTTISFICLKQITYLPIYKIKSPNIDVLL